MERRRNFIISSLVFLTALLAELYCLLEFRGDMLSVLGTGVVLLAAAFITLDSALAFFDNKTVQGKESAGTEELVKHLEELEKIQKASFMAMKKSIACQEQMVQEMSAQMEQQRDVVLKAGKLVAKYEKDGTAELKGVLQELTLHTGFDEKGILEEIVTVNRKLEQLSEELLQVKENMESMQAAQFAFAASNQTEPLINTVSLEEAAVSEEPLEMGAEPFEMKMESGEQVQTAEPELGEKPEPEIEDPNKMMSPDDIAALLASMESGEQVQEAEPELEEKLEPEIEDPNKMMSPDDIAALLASMESGEQVQEAEPEPEEKPEPEIEDPNKMMSPDDIAALLASMGQ